MAKAAPAAVAPRPSVTAKAPVTAKAAPKPPSKAAPVPAAKRSDKPIAAAKTAPAQRPEPAENSCSNRTQFAYLYCMQEICSRSAQRNNAQCAALRRSGELR